MRKLIQWTLFLVLVSLSAPLLAATATDFYVGLLRRGISEVDAGRNADAVTPLRLAAFGLVDSIEHYETAQAYLVVAHDRMNQAEPAREAALRIVAAERIERKFASLALPAPIRTAFASSARKLLASADAALLLEAPPGGTTRTAGTNRTAPAQTPPQTSAKPVETPKIVEEKPAPVTTAQPRVTPPAAKPEQPQPQPVQPARPAIDVPARLAAGERALTTANLAEARKVYRELLDAGGHDHATWIRIAEGLYRSRDFAGALTAFQRVGTLRNGEEAYRYYIAVALYETGQHDRAKRELAAALPFIELTPDVQRYRAKIEGAR